MSLVLANGMHLRSSEFQPGQILRPNTFFNLKWALRSGTQVPIFFKEIGFILTLFIFQDTNKCWPGPLPKE